MFQNTEVCSEYKRVDRMMGYLFQKKKTKSFGTKTRRRMDLLRLIHTYHAVPYHAHAVSLSCRAAKCLDCVFPI
jgi:hypothetical protein